MTNLSRRFTWKNIFPIFSSCAAFLLRYFVVTWSSSFNLERKKIPIIQLESKQFWGFFSNITFSKFSQGSGHYGLFFFFQPKTSVTQSSSALCFLRRALSPQQTDLSSLRSARGFWPGGLIQMDSAGIFQTLNIVDFISCCMQNT